METNLKLETLKQQTQEKFKDNFIPEEHLEEYLNKGIKVYDNDVQNHICSDRSVSSQSTRDKLINAFNHSTYFDPEYLKENGISVEYIPKDSGILIKTKLDPFILQKNDENYKFDKSEFGFLVKMHNDKMLITGQPEMLSRFEHPLVWANHGGIDFQILDWTDLGIQMGRYYSLESNEDFQDACKRIEIVIKRTAQNLRKGYVGKPYIDFTPVNNLQEYCKDNFVPENQLDQYVKQGIQIYDNDKSK